MDDKRLRTSESIQADIEAWLAKGNTIDVVPIDQRRDDALPSMNQVYMSKGKLMDMSRQGKGRKG